MEGRLSLTCITPDFFLVRRATVQRVPEIEGICRFWSAAGRALQVKLVRGWRMRVRWMLALRCCHRIVVFVPPLSGT